MLKCNVCGSSNIEKIFSINNIPFSVFWDLDREKVDFEIVYCNDCGFIFQSSAYSNTTFDIVSSKAYNDYDMTNANFPSLNIPAQNGIEFLKENLNFDTIFNSIEIGSARGDFSFQLKQYFNHLNIIGCEPSNIDSFIPTIKSLFFSSLFSSKFDLVIGRFVLEHIKNPVSFINEISNILNISGYLYIEVPNIEFYLKNYLNEFCPEHINYFSYQSLENLLSISKFKIVNSKTNTDTIHLLAKKSDIELTQLLKNFALKNSLNNYFQQRYNVIKNIAKLITDGKRIVFYGAGNMFIWNYYTLNYMLKNIYNLDLKDFVESAIDDNIKGIAITKAFNIKIENSQEFINRYKNNLEDYIVFISIGNLEVANKIYNNIMNLGFKYIFITWVK